MGDEGFGAVVDLGVCKSCVEGTNYKRCFGYIIVGEDVLTGWSTGTLTMCDDILPVMMRLPFPCFLNTSPAYFAQ